MEILRNFEKCSRILINFHELKKIGNYKVFMNLKRKNDRNRKIKRINKRETHKRKKEKKSKKETQEKTTLEIGGKVKSSKPNYAAGGTRLLGTIHSTHGIRFP